MKEYTFKNGNRTVTVVAWSEYEAWIKVGVVFDFDRKGTELIKAVDL